MGGGIWASEAVCGWAAAVVSIVAAVKVFCVQEQVNLSKVSSLKVALHLAFAAPGRAPTLIWHSRFDLEFIPITLLIVCHLVFYSCGMAHQDCYI